MKWAVTGGGKGPEERFLRPRRQVADGGLREFSPEEQEYIRLRIMPTRRERRGNGEWIEAGPATEEELKEFLLKSRAYNLDPVLGMIYASRRKGSLVIAPTIDGLRHMAARTREMDGQDAPEYGYADKSKIPEWCRVTVWRKGCKHGTVAIVWWAEYVRGRMTDTQREMPHLMLAKAAEAQALRKAFPDALGGIVTLEEMGTTGQSADEPKAPPWEQDAESPHKPNPPKISAAESLAIAREQEARAQRALETRRRQEQAVADAVADRQQEQAAEEQAYRPGKDAKWWILAGVALDKLSAAGEAVVLKQPADEENGGTRVDVRGLRTGKESSVVFPRGPAAAALSALHEGDHVWVKLGPDKKAIAAYHVPPKGYDKDQERKVS